MKILIIPDAQVRAGVPTGHLVAAARYAVKHLPDIIVVMGDWWDMPSLSVFNSSLQADGARIQRDIWAGEFAMEDFLKPIKEESEKRRRQKRKKWEPRLVYCVGNHDPQVRIPRYIESHPVLEGFLECQTDLFLKSLGFEVIPYLDIINIEGIRFSHYFQNPYSAKGTPLSGTIENMIKCAGFSFVQGHLQKYKIGKVYLGDGSNRLGLVCGAFYDHEETYMGKQANNHWRGIVMLTEVANGGADVCEISLEYLKKKYGQSS